MDQPCQRNTSFSEGHQTHTRSRFVQVILQLQQALICGVDGQLLGEVITVRVRLSTMAPAADGSPRAGVDSVAYNLVGVVALGVLAVDGDMRNETDPSSNDGATDACSEPAVLS